MEKRDSALFNLINTLGKQSAPNSAPATPISDDATVVEADSLAEKLLDAKADSKIDSAILL